jgi:hypothetical protein
MSDNTKEIRSTICPGFSAFMPERLPSPPLSPNRRITKLRHHRILDPFLLLADDMLIDPIFPAVRPFRFLVFPHFSYFLLASSFSSIFRRSFLAPAGVNLAGDVATP